MANFLPPARNLTGIAELAPSALSGAALAGGTAAGGFNPLLLLPIIFSFLQSTGIFGGGEEDELDELLALTRPRQPIYQSPNTRRMDPIVMNALLNQFKRTANWGWPAGQSMDLGFLSGLGPGLSGGLTKRDRLPPSSMGSLIGR